MWQLQLRAEGLDIDVDDEEACPLEITQGTDIGVCDFGKYIVACAIPVCIVALARTVVKDYYIESSWGDQIELPGDLKVCDGHYKLGRLSFPTREVLNDRFDEPFAMNRGAILQGVILAFGCVALELTARVVPVLFGLVDTLGRVSQGEIRLAQYCTESRKLSSELESQLIARSPMQHAAAPRPWERGGEDLRLEEDWGVDVGSRRPRSLLKKLLPVARRVW